MTSIHPLKNMRDLSVNYTPGVARVCEAIAADPVKARGYTGNGNTVAIISDGSAVLGLGNIGPSAALPVMVGKAQLFQQFAGLNAIPVVLLAALRNAAKVLARELADLRVVVSGAGAAGIACVNMLLDAGAPDIVVLDSRGVIHSGREDSTRSSGSWRRAPTRAASPAARPGHSPARASSSVSPVARWRRRPSCSWRRIRSFSP